LPQQHIHRSVYPQAVTHVRHVQRSTSLRRRESHFDDFLHSDPARIFRHAAAEVLQRHTIETFHSLLDDGTDLAR